MAENWFEVAEQETVSREAAAARLRALADQLARHNEFEFMRDGVRHTVDVPSQVQLKIELELNDDESEIEVEITW